MTRAYRAVATTAFTAVAVLGCSDSTSPPSNTPPVNAGSCVQYENFTHWAGTLNLPRGAGDPTIEANVAYVPSGQEVQIVDLSVPEAPRLAGSIRLDGTVGRIVVRGRIAYVSVGSLVLQVLDMSDSSKPVVLGNEVFIEGISDLDVEGDYAYVGTMTGLHVLDVSDPMHPARLRMTTLSSARRVRVSGSLAYVVPRFGTELFVVDVSDPAAPSLVSQTQVGPFVNELELSGKHLFVTTPFDIFVLSQGRKPHVIAQAETRGQNGDLEVQENHVYVVVTEFPSRTTGVQVFRASDRGALKPVSYIPTPMDFGPPSIAVHAGHVFVADGRAGLKLFANPFWPAVEALSNLDVGDRVQDVVGAGDYLFVAAWYRGLVVVDVSDSDRPAVVGRAAVQGVAEGVAVSGSHAYVTEWESGLRIVDISDPLAPRGVGWVDTPGYAKHVAVDGDHAYVADNIRGLQVVDVSNPAAPRIVASVATPGLATDIAVQGGLAYVATFGALHVIDVSNPASPVEIGSAVTGAAWSIAVRGSRAYLAAGGMEIFDISDSRSPVRIGAMESPREFRGVDVVGDTAYLVDTSFGVVAVDVATPALPRVIGTVGIDGFSHRIVQHHGKLFVANHAGIVVAAPQCD